MIIAGYSTKNENIEYLSDYGELGDGIKCSPCTDLVLVYSLAPHSSPRNTEPGIKPGDPPNKSYESYLFKLLSKHSIYRVIIENK